MRLICMAFDGEFVTERTSFKSTEEAWNHCDDMGSRWHFYPFPFIVSESGKTIVDSPHGLSFLNGRRVTTVVRLFSEHAAKPEMQGADTDAFVGSL